MRKITVFILCFALLVCSLGSIAVSAESVGNTYYIDSENGNDENSGLSEASAWRTAARATSETYGAGDRILFGCGQVFVGAFSANGSGTADNPIYLGSFGEGAKPVLMTNDSSVVITLNDVSFWTVENLDITSPQGGGVYVGFSSTTVRGIELRSLSLHNIRNYPSDTYRSNERAALRLGGGSAVYGTHIENMTIAGCEIYDCGYGISMAGNFPNTPATPYNKNIIVENCSLHDIWDDAFIISRCDNLVFRNSSVLNTTMSAGVYYTAPVWTWAVTNSLIENIEIGGAKNYLDGMAVDFDDHTDSTTYQYIYSHDNICFFWSCVYIDDHFDNTVRYCLSVNDNVRSNGFNSGDSYEENFKFYNNTIVGGSSFSFEGADNAVIQNNIFSLNYGERVIFNRKNNYTVSNNCYNNIFAPLMDKAPIIKNARFAGDDENDKNSYMLFANSPCIGAGVQVEEDMGERDFYGNALTGVHNIGCYEGEGVEVQKTKLTSLSELFAVILTAILSVFTQAGIC